MDHFQIHAPTQIIFGKNTENEAGKWCKYYGAHKVLVHFGGHSAKKSGLLDRVCASRTQAWNTYCWEALCLIRSFPWLRRA